MTDQGFSPPRWQTPPLIEGGSVAAPAEPRQETVEVLYQQAREEGFAAGKQEALELQRAWVEERLDQLSQILHALTQPYENLNQMVVEELTRLAGKIAQQLFRRELQTSPDAIIAVVREAVALLPTERSNIKVYLNDEDARLVRELSGLTDSDRNWDVLNDPSIARGDCLVTMGASLIDASVEARTNAIIAQILGSQRQADSGDG